MQSPIYSSGSINWSYSSTLSKRWVYFNLLLLFGFNCFDNCIHFRWPWYRAFWRQCASSHDTSFYASWVGIIQNPYGNNDILMCLMIYAYLLLIWHSRVISVLTDIVINQCSLVVKPFWFPNINIHKYYNLFNRC